MVPHVLTLTNYVSQAAKIFELLGKVTPIAGDTKVDIKSTEYAMLRMTLFPNKLIDCRFDSFDLMNGISGIGFKRAIVHANAVDLNMELSGLVPEKT